MTGKCDEDGGKGPVQQRRPGEPTVPSRRTSHIQGISIRPCKTDTKEGVPGRRSEPITVSAYSFPHLNPSTHLGSPLSFLRQPRAIEVLVLLFTFLLDPPFFLPLLGTYGDSTLKWTVVNPRYLPKIYSSLYHRQDSRLTLLVWSPTLSSVLQ